MKSTVSLFLAQAYKDAWDDYVRSLHRNDFLKWDYVVLTASNEQQAQGFRAQISERIRTGFLSDKTCFEVVADPEGKRVGSGGATLNILKHFSQKWPNVDVSTKRVLIIHSGGDSKRIPQYSAIGKLFSPIPRKLPNGRASTLFDELIIGMSGVPGRIREGMVLLSGDVLLLFNALQINFSGKDAAAISFKEHVETGKNHGVYLIGEDDNVAQFLHKQTVQTLREKGAVSEKDTVDIDTGAVIFSEEIVRALYSLISENGTVSEHKFAAMVNDKVRLSLYGDFLYPLASQSTLENYYNEKPEGVFCPELEAARTVVWKALRPFRMKLLRLSPSKFTHFGTTGEIARLMAEDIEQYAHLDWCRRVNSSTGKVDVAAYNSILAANAVCGENVYLESSHVHASAKIGNNVILSNVEVDNVTVPDNVVLHGLKQKDGHYVVRIYGISDNPKEELAQGATLLGRPLIDVLKNNGIAESEVWETKAHDIWNARLYPVADSMEKAVAAALNFYAMLHDCGNVEEWRGAQRKSMCSGFNDADVEALLAWNKDMQDMVRMGLLQQAIVEGKPYNCAGEILGATTLSKVQQRWLEKWEKTASYSEKMRMYYYIAAALGGSRGEEYLDSCFATIRNMILCNTPGVNVYRENCRIICNEHTEKLPLRVNWGGGWTDTPPYCNEQGGTVLNTAVLLNGEMPVEVTLKRMQEYKIVFQSEEAENTEEYTSIQQLQSYADPYDPYALPKAALVASGIIPRHGGDLQQVLKRLGGGIYMRTCVNGVPKGSGLGTSSILSGACVKAIFEFFGIAYTQDDIFATVLAMEQLMTTGGGWQDQVGGLSNGIKYITSYAGYCQKLQIEHLSVSAQVLQQLNHRFALIYTGQRRLARNLLRNVVGSYIGNMPNTLHALSEMRNLSGKMRNALEAGNIDEFAGLLSQHWEMSKLLDESSTNAGIEHIFNSIEDLISGKMIVGAGGGGFLQVVLKHGVSKQQLQDRLQQEFQDSGIVVWQSQLV